MEHITVIPSMTIAWLWGDYWATRIYRLFKKSCPPFEGELICFFLRSTFLFSKKSLKNETRQIFWRRMKIIHFLEETIFHSLPYRFLCVSPRRIFNSMKMFQQITFSTWKCMRLIPRRQRINEGVGVWHKIWTSKTNFRFLPLFIFGNRLFQRKTRLSDGPARGATGRAMPWFFHVRCRWHGIPALCSTLFLFQNCYFWKKCVNCFQNRVFSLYLSFW